MVPPGRRHLVAQVINCLRAECPSTVPFRHVFTGTAAGSWASGRLAERRLQAAFTDAPNPG